MHVFMGICAIAIYNAIAIYAIAIYIFVQYIVFVENVFEAFVYS